MGACSPFVDRSRQMAIFLVLCSIFSLVNSSTFAVERGSVETTDVIDSENAVPLNRVIFQVANPESFQITSAFSQNAAESGATSISPLSISKKSSSLYLMETRSIENSKVLVNFLKKQSEVKFASIDYEYRIARQPNDLDFSKQWGLPAIGAEEFWNGQTGSKSTVIAVLDTGIEFNHPDLKDNIWFNVAERDGLPGVDDDANGYIDDVNGWDFIDNDNLPQDDIDLNYPWGGGHGSHVSGIIGAKGNNGIGIAGVNWDVSIMPLRVCSKYGGCSTSAWLSALQYAKDNGARVANMSLGGYQSDSNAIALEESVINSVGESIGHKGVLVVAAAGNNGLNNDFADFYPASHRLSNLVSVAASDDSPSNGSSIAHFSNTGTWKVDLAAPGYDILSTLPEGAFKYTGGYGKLSGTSMASPFVAGAAGLILTSKPELSASQLKTNLMVNSKQAPEFKRLTRSGGSLFLPAANVLNLSTTALSNFFASGSGTGLVEIWSGETKLCSSASCILQLPSGTYEVKAIPGAGSSFMGWYGTCVDAISTTCSVEIDGQLGTSFYAVFGSTQSSPISYEKVLMPETDPLWDEDLTFSQYGNFRNIAYAPNLMSRLIAFHKTPPSPYCWQRSPIDAECGRILYQRKVRETWTTINLIPAPIDSVLEVCRNNFNSDFGQDVHTDTDLKLAVVNLGIGCWNQGMTHAESNFSCGFTVLDFANDSLSKRDDFIYRGTDCITTEFRQNWKNSALSHDGKTLVVSGYESIKVFDLTNWVNGTGQPTNVSVSVPYGCKVNSTWFPGDRNVSISGSGTRILIPVTNCTSALSGGVLLFEKVNSQWSAKNPFPLLNSEHQRGSQVSATSISKDGKSVVISHDGNGVYGAFLYEEQSNTWSLSRNLKDTIANNYGPFLCRLTPNNQRLFCASKFSDEGYNRQQGRIVVLEKKTDSWKTGTLGSYVLVNPFGHSNDLTSTQWIHPEGSSVVINYSAQNIAKNFSPRFYGGVLAKLPAATGKTAQTITFNPPASLPPGASPTTLTATATSGLSVSFASTTPNVCTIAGSVLTPVNQGTCSVTASQAGDATYSPAKDVTKSIKILKSSQTITFDAPPSISPGAGATTLTATATSGLSVSFASTTPNICTIVGSTLTPVNQGTCSITASQAGDATYSPARDVKKSIKILKSSQTITFDAPTSISPGAGATTLNATATSGLTVSFASTTPNICTMSGSTLTPVNQGTCSVTASQAGDATYSPARDVKKSIKILKTAQTITFTPPASISPGAGDTTLSATASSGLSVSFASTTPNICTISGSTLTPVNQGTCSITASQAGDSTFSPARDVKKSIKILKTAQTITFTPPASISLASGTLSLSATASSNLSVSFASTTPAICTLDGSTLTLVAKGTCSVTASQAGDATYSPARDVKKSIKVLTP